MNRRLQTQVHKRALANSVHHPRSLVYQRHISVENQLVSQPAFLVWKDSEKNIKYFATSVMTTEKTGRKKRMCLHAQNKKAGEDFE